MNVLLDGPVYDDYMDHRDLQHYKTVVVGEQEWFAEKNVPPGWRIPTGEDYKALYSYAQEHSKEPAYTALMSKTLDWLLGNRLMRIRYDLCEIVTF